jgi:hypothetical protein
MRDMTTQAFPDVGSIATDPDVFEVFYREHLEACSATSPEEWPIPISPPI